MKSKTEQLIDNYLKNLAKESVFIEGSLSREIKYIAHNKERYICALNEIEALLKSVNYLPNLKVGEKKQICILDVGTSLFTFILREMFSNAEIYSIDYTNKYKEVCKLKRIHFKKIDLNKQRISFGATKFDLITFLEVLEHLLTDGKQVIENIASIMALNGYSILETPNKYSPKAQIDKIFSLSKQKTSSKEFVHFKEYSLGEIVKIINGIKKIKIIKKEHLMYFDGINSATVYRRYIRLFQPLIWINYLVVKNIPFLRRGIQVIFQKVG